MVATSTPEAAHHGNGCSHTYTLVTEYPVQKVFDSGSMVGCLTVPVAVEDARSQVLVSTAPATWERTTARPAAGWRRAGGGLAAG
jgi:hypothetical protein